jgi:hypothetical protein
MTPMHIAGLINGTLDWKDPREYLEACLNYSLTSSADGLVQPRKGFLALQIADYAVDHGEEAAIKVIMQAKHGEAN